MINQVTQSVGSLSNVQSSPKNVPTDPTGVTKQAQEPKVRESAEVDREKPGESGTIKREADELVQGLNSFVQKIQRKLQFSVDTDSGTTVIKVLNRETDELVRQIPSENIMTLRENLSKLQDDLYKGELPGFLFSAEV